ncbi:MAG: hypothetical protein ACP5HU_06970 [Phycisphaerae bacterium]
MNMLGAVSLSGSLRITVVVAPVAVYFLILGLLNSRRRPQLLTARLDLLLLLVPLSPLVLLPVLEYLGTAAALATGGVLAGAGVFLTRGRAEWVIYNMPDAAGRRAVSRAFEQVCGCESRQCDSGLEAPVGDLRVEISSFPLLRNLTVRLKGGDEVQERWFEAALTERLTGVHAETSPTAVALLLVATGMLVMPLMLIAPRAGEIVRLLGDLLP